MNVDPMLKVNYKIRKMLNSLWIYGAVWLHLAPDIGRLYPGISFNTDAPKYTHQGYHKGTQSIFWTSSLCLICAHLRIKFILGEAIDSFGGKDRPEDFSILFHLINIKLKHWPDGTSTILLASLISAMLQFIFFCELLFMDVSSENN
jgi:hypothetical protein